MLSSKPWTSASWAVVSACQKASYSSSVHGAVDIIRPCPYHTGSPTRRVSISTLSADTSGAAASKKWRSLSSPSSPCSVLRQRVGGQGAGGHHDLPLSGSSVTSPGINGDVGDGCGSAPSPELAKPWRSTARAPPASTRVASAQCEDQAAQPPQLLLQKAHGVFQPVAPRGSWSSTAPQSSPLCGRGSFSPASSPVRLYLNSPLGQLPGAFAAGQARADDCYVP